MPPSNILTFSVLRPNDLSASGQHVHRCSAPLRSAICHRSCAPRECRCRCALAHQCHHVCETANASWPRPVPESGHAYSWIASSSALAMTASDRRNNRPHYIRRPLCSRKRTCAAQTPMSALGQKRTFAVQNGMSALPPKATSNAPYGDVAKSGHRALHSITSSARFCTAPIAQSCFASKGQKELAALYAVNDISVPLRVLRKNKAPQQTGDERCGNR